MKKKTGFTKRLFSILLCMVLLIGSIPLTASAASSAAELGHVDRIPYTDGCKVYFHFNNYLYEAAITNLNNKVTNVNVGKYESPTGNLRLSFTPTDNDIATTINIYSANSGSDQISVSSLPKTENGSIDGYGKSSDYILNASTPIVTIKCLAVNAPDWTWNGTSSATANFTSTDNAATFSAEATVEAVEQAADNCLSKDQTTYTASVTVNGKEYTDTKTVDGDPGPHDIEYIVSGNTITANCKNDGCPSGTGNSVTLNLENVYDYTGNPIPDPVTGGFNHNMATYKVTYNGSEDIPSAVGNYRIALNVYDENGKEKNGIERNFKIEYLPSPNLSEFRVRGQKYSEMVYGPHWFAPGNMAEVASPDGYMISTMQNVTYGISVSFNADDDKTAYLRRESDGVMTDAIDLSAILKWDSDTPTGKITLSTGNIWTHLINEISFGMFFKEAKTAAITAEDTESGVKSVEYYVADHDLINGGNAAALETVVAGNWSTYNDTVSLPLNGKYIVYAKLTDNVGNVTYMCSDGIVLYSDSTTETTSLSTTYRKDEDVSFTVNLNDNTVNTVEINGETLIANTDYTVSGDGKIALKASYLNSLNAGDYTVEVSFNPLGEPYVEAEGNEAPAEIALPLEIKKANYDMSHAMWLYNGALDYDGMEKTVEVTGLPGSLAARYTGNKAVDVGEYTASVEIDYDSVNYNEPVMPDLNWEIVNDWTPEKNTEYAVSPPNEHGWLNGSFEIFAAEGYLLSLTNTDDSEWVEKLTYSEETANGSVTFYVRNTEDKTISLAANETYKLDTTPPTGKVSLDELNNWQSFVHDISFGLFYPTEVTVKVTPNDTLSGIAKVEYAASDKALTLEEVKALTSWNEMENNKVGVTLEDAKQFVYFIRITDNAGNITYLSTDGAVYDTTKPVISGIKNGGTYYTTQKFSVSDTNLEHVAVNEMLISDPSAFILPGNTEAEYVVWAEDKARNTVTFVIHMKPIRALSEPLDNLTPNNVTSDDADILAEIGNAIATENTVNATEEEIAELAATAMHIRALSDTVNAAAEAVGTESVDETLEVTAENVKLEQQADLEKAKEDLEEALETYGKNYTEEETELILDAIDRIEAALKAIENVKDIEAVISALPETAAPEDEDAVIAIDSAKMVYGALTENEKALVSAKAKEKLEKLLKAAVDYKIVEGHGEKWNAESDKPFTFTANGSFKKFVGIAVNSKEVDKKHYDAKAGSTIITLKESFLETLSTGDHELAVLYTDGEAECTFHVEKVPAPSAEPTAKPDTGTESTPDTKPTASPSAAPTKAPIPATGDTNDLPLWATILCAGIAALTAYITYKKRTK